MDQPAHTNTFMERQVISAVLLTGESAYTTVQSSGANGALTEPRNRAIWFALATMHESGDLASGAPADVLAEVLSTTSAEALGGSPHEMLLDLVGGLAGVAEYFSAMGGTIQLAKSCEDLVKMRRRRDIIRHTRAALNKMLRPEEKPEQVATQLEQTLGDMGSAAGQAVYRTIDQMAEATERHREHMASLPDAALSWGLRKLDDAVELALGRMVVIAGRPGSGKSSLGLRSLIETATKGTRCAFVSLELSETDLYGRLEQSGLHRGEPAAERIECMSGVSLTATGLIAAVRRAARKGARLIMVDYIQRIAGESVRETEYQRITQASMGLTSIAVEEGVCVCALAQLNRGNQQGDKIRAPRVADLKGSGSLEQDAAAVILLHQEEQDSQHRTIIIGKSRFGELGHMMTRFDGARNQFTYVDTQGQQSEQDEPRGKYDQERQQRAREVSDLMDQAPSDSEDLFA